ncbi:MAG: hypothetical protein KDC85_11910 [Saprospiraceae bacterium]|nr:hypothetical protein [Saprospiraceae bacterium]MCB9326207.1 hypothetical protein [Lewinellaceae bacterium]
MRVLLFSNQGLSVPHLGIELEILEGLKQQGHEVDIVKCNSKVNACYFNPAYNLPGCAICEARSDVFYREIGLDQDRIFRMKWYEEARTFKAPFFEQLNDLFEYNYKGANLGLGVASSIISLQRNYDVNSHTFGELIEQLLRSAINVYLNFEQFADQFKPDYIYLFNGRFAETHALIELAQQKGIPFRTFEKGATYHTYEVYDNCLPHSIKTRQVNIDYYWNKADEKEKVATAEAWFYDKIKGTHKNDKSYLDKMEKGKLPDDFDRSKTNIAIFNSSEDEFKAIREWQNALFYHQNDAIKQMVEHFQDNPDIHFYLRVHPNLGKVNNMQTRGIEEMDYPNLTVIPAFDDVDTYALMRAADKTVGFGSSTVVEATFWGKPSILYGKAFYMGLDCVYVPQSFEALTKLILEKDLPPKERRNTYKYAYYVSSRGEKLEHFKWNGKFNSHYKGLKMKRFYPETVAYLFKFVGNIPKWIQMNKLVRGRGFKISDIGKLKGENVLK